MPNTPLITEQAVRAAMDKLGDWWGHDYAPCDVAMMHAALEAALPHLNAWRPIETLPAFRTAFVGCWFTACEKPFFMWTTGHWYEWKGEKVWSLLRHLQDLPPTHWQPEFPPPPAEEQQT